MISSTDAKATMPARNMIEVRNYLAENEQPIDDVSVKIVYLGYLCARGMLNEASDFIGTLGDDTWQVLNTPHNIFYNGTVFHVALVWNSGDLGQSFFELMWSNGAQYYENSYGEFPWEQLGEGARWINPIGYNIIGNRDPDEFVELYDHLYELYNLEEFEEQYVQLENDESTGDEMEIVG
jgi:hypothetical protein